jgi:hypothetical protein
MKTPNSLNPHSLKEFLLPVILGAGMPLILLVFILLTREDSVETWMFFPLLIIPSGGAVGGIFFYLMGFRWFPYGYPKLIAVLFSTLTYFFILWFSAVIAFALTGHWN